MTTTRHKHVARKTAARTPAARKPVSRMPAAGKSASRPPAARGKDVVSQLTAIERDGGSGTVAFPSGATLDVSSLGKTYFPGDGITKGDVMRYYARVAPVMLPFLTDRPLVLKRYPDGIDGPSFFQQNAPDDAPKSARVEEIRTTKGEVHRRLVGGDLLTLLYTVQLGAIDVHPWLSRIKAIDAPDYSVLDLDPGPKAGFARVVSAALMLREMLEKAGYPSAVKTSGSRGLHLFVPMPSGASFVAAQEFGRTIAAAAAEKNAKDVTVERRIGKRPPAAVYVDFLQNAEGKSVAAPFSVRARKGATVSTPLNWTEVNSRLTLASFTIATVPPEAARRARLWKERLKG